MKTVEEIKERIRNLAQRAKEQENACGNKTIDLKEFYRRMDIIKTAINELVWVMEDSEDEKSL